MVRRMNLLAIDTALERCSVGVAAGGRPAGARVGDDRPRPCRAAVRHDLRRRWRTPGSAFRTSTASRSPSAPARSPASGSASPRPAASRWSPAARSPASARSTPSPKLQAEVAGARAGAGRPRREARTRSTPRPSMPTGGPLSEPAVGSRRRIRRALVEGMVLAGSGARLVAALARPSRPDRPRADRRRTSRALLRLGLAAPEPSGPPRPLYLRPPDAKPQAAAAVARQ